MQCHRSIITLAHHSASQLHYGGQAPLLLNSLEMDSELHSHLFLIREDIQKLGTQIIYFV